VGEVSVAIPKSPNLTSEVKSYAHGVLQKTTRGLHNRAWGLTWGTWLSTNLAGQIINPRAMQTPTFSK
jgi:hypothetical protein